MVTQKGQRLCSYGFLGYPGESFKINWLSWGSIPKFGLHSLRSGGATDAAYSDIPDRLFKRHGRWRSESAKHGYDKDSLAFLY